MDEQRQDDQLEPIYVSIQDITLKTCREQWTIDMGGGKGSGRSVLAARHDDDDIGKFENKPFGRREKKTKRKIKLADFITRTLSPEIQLFYKNEVNTCQQWKMRAIFIYLFIYSFFHF